MNNAYHKRVVVATNTYQYRLMSQTLLKAVHVYYTADATVGNRGISLGIYDADGNELYDWHAGVNITANDVTHVEFMSGMPRETQLSGPNSDHMVVGIAELLISGQYSLRIHDEANVSSGDSMEINFWGER